MSGQYKEVDDAWVKAVKLANIELDADLEAKRNGEQGKISPSALATLAKTLHGSRLAESKVNRDKLELLSGDANFRSGGI